MGSGVGDARGSPCAPPTPAPPAQPRRGRGRSRGRCSVSRCSRVSRCRSAPGGGARSGGSVPSARRGRADARRERRCRLAAGSGRVKYLNSFHSLYLVFIVFIVLLCVLSLLCREVSSPCFFPAPLREPFRAVRLQVVVETLGWWWSSLGSVGMVIFLNQK